MPTHPDLTSRTCVITGATDGIGLVTARELARRNATVLLLARSPGRGAAAADAIATATGRPPPRVIALDLASQASIRLAARRVADAAPAIHLLINNAGAVFTRRTLSPDGIEMTLAVNHLGPFLLTRLLLPLMTPPDARIVNVASAAHRRATLESDNLQGERRYRAWAAYSRSKLCNILFTRELARRLEGSGTTANCLHPGVVRTGLGDKSGRVLRMLWRLASPFMIDARRGADTTIHLACSPEVAGVSGHYFASCAIAQSSPLSRNDEMARWLWRESERLTGIAP